MASYKAMREKQQKRMACSHVSKKNDLASPAPHSPPPTQGRTEARLQPLQVSFYAAFERPLAGTLLGRLGHRTSNGLQPGSLCYLEDC